MAAGEVGRDWPLSTAWGQDGRVSRMDRPDALDGDMSAAPPVLAPHALPARAVDGLAAAGIGLVTDPAVLSGHCVDWTGAWSGPATGLVRPRSTEEVAAVLAVARDHGLHVQVQGGNTGLVGGSVPDRPALILLTSGLDRVHPIDTLERSVVVGAGVTAAALAAHARAAGLLFGVDLAARDSATIGGMVATNAGGVGVVAHGMMRQQVRGLTAVLADGRVIRHVGRPRKDNTGIDVGGLLIGSEGTLGVITEVEVVLHPAPPATSVALVATATLREAMAVARSVQSAVPLLAAEVVDAYGVAQAAAAPGVPNPLPAGAPWLLLLEVADWATGEGFESIADRVLALALEPADQQRLWAYREQQTELYAAAAGPDLQKLDISLRLDRLDLGVAAIRARVADAHAQGAPGPTGDPGQEGDGGPRVGFFGHALDGNLHVQLIGAAPELGVALLELVSDLGGSISAEHGIGRLKAPHLHLARSEDEITWMREVKLGVDPSGLLNPGVLFSAD